MERSKTEEANLLASVNKIKMPKKGKTIILISGVDETESPLLLSKQGKLYKKIPKDYFLKKLRKQIKKVGDKIGDTKAFSAIRNTKAYQKIGKPLLKVGVPIIAGGAAGLALGKLAAGKGLGAKILGKLTSKPGKPLKLGKTGLTEIKKPKGLLSRLKVNTPQALKKKVGEKGLKGLAKKLREGRVGQQIENNVRNIANEKIAGLRNVASEGAENLAARFMANQQTALTTGREMDTEINYPDEMPKVATASIGGNLNFKNPLVIGGVILAAILLFGGFKSN